MLIGGCFFFSFFSPSMSQTWKKEKKKRRSLKRYILQFYAQSWWDKTHSWPLSSAAYVTGVLRHLPEWMKARGRGTEQTSPLPASEEGWGCSNRIHICHRIATTASYPVGWRLIQTTSNESMTCRQVISKLLIHWKCLAVFFYTNMSGPDVSDTYHQILLKYWTNY